MFVSQNSSDFLAESYVSTDKLGKKSLVVVIRATFDVLADGTAIPGVQTPYVFADTFFDGDETTSVQFESDFAPIKPRPEVLLNANAVASSDKPVEELLVSLFGPGLEKHAVVTGKRYWMNAVLGIESTPPVPFFSLPLAWHLAFGGADTSHQDPRKHRCELRNPVGTGFHVNAKSDSLEGLALPCIEHPRYRIYDWRDTPEPVGFSSVSRFAKPRIGFAGTYDQKWMDEVLPFLPQDFDDRYFQSAPVDQQLDSLQEGAEFMCLNMSADGRFFVRLPALNIAVAFLFDDRRQRIVVPPDTLIIEPHTRRIILLGRASVNLPRKFTRLREVVVEPERNRQSRKRHYNSLAEAVEMKGVFR
jgi:hypothetical protein